MMIGMTIDVVENSAWALRTAALGALVFDVFYVVHRLLQGFGPDDATPAGISAFSLAHRSALLASEVAVGLALLAVIVFIAAFASLIRQAGRGHSRHRHHGERGGVRRDGFHLPGARDRARRRGRCR
jgi:hypothetical protein